MKKAISFLLGLTLALSLAACGWPGASASQAVPSNPPEETEAVSAAPVETQDIATPVPEQQSEAGSDSDTCDMPRIKRFAEG